MIDSFYKYVCNYVYFITKTKPKKKKKIKAWFMDESDEDPRVRFTGPIGMSQFTKHSLFDLIFFFFFFWFEKYC